jgi:hypothetical protein
MSIRDERTAEQHPAYKDSIKQAVKLAAVGNEALVCLDGDKLFVRPVGQCPAGATIVCVAQKWSKHVVQLRFAGARSEWVHAS